MSDTHEKVITISTKTLLKVVLIVALIWFVWFIRDIAFAFFVAVLLSSLIGPIADAAERRKIPRGVTTLVIYLIVVGVFVLIIRQLVPVIITEGKSFAGNFGQMWNHFFERMDFLKDAAQRLGFFGEGNEGGVSAFQPTIEHSVSQLFSKLSGIVNGLFTVILTFVLTFYLVVNENAVQAFIQSLTPEEKRPFVTKLVIDIRQKLGFWLRGQLTLSLLMGVMVYLMLLVVGVEYPLILALFAALMEAVPYLGPTLAAVPPVFIALAQNPTTFVPAITVMILFVIIQQIENHLLVPKVMQKVVGLNPVVSILSIIIGFKLAGIIGALLAIPTITSLHVFLDAWRQRHTQ